MQLLPCAATGHAHKSPGGGAATHITQTSNTNVRKGNSMNSNETAHNPLDGITATLEKALQQAREQADTIIANARKEAERIINDARTQADTIINDAQADARAKGDMERASLAIQEHAAALHTLALGLTGHDTTPHDNASGSAGDDSAGSSDADTGTNTDTNKTDAANNASPNNANTHGTDVIPPAPPVTTSNNTPTANAPTSTSRTTVTAHPTTRRANGTTRKLAPWETPEEPQSETATEPEETLASNTTGTNAEQDPPAPQWDAPLIIDAPLQL